MRCACAILIAAIALTCFADQLYGETTYFLVAERALSHGDSYVLPLTDSNDIAHARDLIKYGPSAGQAIVVARIACNYDCINRDYLNAAKRAWSWHVAEFVGFEDITAEILDGWPGDVERDCQWWIANTGGNIGFWSYTVVAELGTDPKHWTRDFWPDNNINMRDFAMLASYWLRADCNASLWCGGTDLNKNGSVDYDDLRIFTEAWLSPFAHKPLSLWFPCWDNPRQCHGDADGKKEGLYWWVAGKDLTILQACYPLPVYYGDPRYNPCADFDRDGDVDDDDVAILETWYMKPNVPADCPCGPYCP
jgi:hypothetical protein